MLRDRPAEADALRSVQPAFAGLVQPHPSPTLRRHPPNPGSRIMSRAAFCQVVLAFTVIGCSADAPGRARGEWAGSIVDSAGIRVVTNPPEALWEASESWRPVEDLEISDRATPGLEFGEIIDVDVDSRGRILALDGMAKAYHVFGPDGAHLMTVGRPGGGPGELADPFQLLVLPGDSVLVPDVGNARASVFAPDGSLARTFPVDFLDLAARRWGIAHDGTVVARRAESTADVLVRLGAAGEVLDTVARLDSPFRPGAGGGPVLLAPVPVWTALPAGGVAHGHSHSYRITVSDSQGAMRLAFSRPVNPAPLSESQRDVVRAGLRATVVEQGVPEAAADQLLAQLAFWDALPVIAELLPGPEATYWVQRAAAPEAMRFDRLNVYRTDGFRGDAWDVFDADGRCLGEVRFPSGVRLLRIRDGLLYGIRLDELDVPSIVRFRLERGPAGA